MKDLKYEHQSTFPLWGRVKLNFRDRYRKLNIFSKNSSHYQVFHQILKNCNFGVKKKKSLSTQMDLYDPYIVPSLFPWGIIIFQGVLTNSTFRQNFHIWKKIVDLMKDLKYEHQSIFPM